MDSLETADAMKNLKYPEENSREKIEDSGCVAEHIKKGKGVKIVVCAVGTCLGVVSQSDNSHEDIRLPSRF